MKLGAYLKEKRENSGITLKEIQEKSGIRKSIIKTIEADDFSRLPDPRHTKYLIGQYADTLGLDGNALIEKHADEFPDYTVEGKKRHQSGNEDYKYLKKVLISFLVMIGVLFTGWMILLQIGSEADIFEQKPVYDVSDVSIEESEEASEEESTEETPEESTEEASTEEAAGNTEFSFTGSEGNTLYYDIQTDGPFTLSLSGGSASWVTLSDDAGNTYAYEELSEGEFDIAEEANILYLTLGNSTDFSVMVDGETLDDAQKPDAVTVYYQFNIEKE
ncbi:helix-turn-helix domain-containing protein [Salinicoccus albus]|uniref:helix-turn-helix domain-containing protein n=1 Tax=Salinicoccus albus TaxID=418756 RepID=UPI0003658261|nr:RodZ domain-containing protein [Salinicoccus albus]